MAAKLAKAALIDLDGTLLPMDTGQFMQTYTSHVAKCICAWGAGLEPQEMVESIWRSMGALAQERDGTTTNEELFWRSFCQLTGLGRAETDAYFRRYYLSNFAEMQVHCGFQPLVYDLLGELRSRGYAVVIATNPVFPRIALEKRLDWAGVQGENLALITDYESSHWVKPQQAYYREIMQKMGVSAENCLMIGNDARDDMIPADSLGMRCYMVTDCAMNAERLPSHVANGSFNMLLRWVRALPEEEASGELTF